jgi:hypothetical protein
LIWKVRLPPERQTAADAALSVKVEDVSPFFDLAYRLLAQRFPRLHEGWPALPDAALNIALRQVLWNGEWEAGFEFLRQQAAAPGLAGIESSAVILTVPVKLPAIYDPKKGVLARMVLEDFPPEVHKDFGTVTHIPSSVSDWRRGKIEVSFDAGADEKSIEQAFKTRLTEALKELKPSAAIPAAGRPHEWARQEDAASMPKTPVSAAIAR